MSTIAEKLTLLNKTKTDIKAAIETKGQTVGNIPFSQYAAKIRAVQTEGNGGGTDMSGDLILVRTGKMVGIGQTWAQPLSFTLRIGNFHEGLLDPNQYRLVFMFTRKTRYSTINSGIRWVVPMLASTKRNKDGFSLPENETYVPIIGKKMEVTFPNHFRPKLRLYNMRFLFRQTNNSRLKIGVAIFKYTGVSDPGWYRCSNIYGVEYCLGNRRISNPNYFPKQINTRYIME